MEASSRRQFVDRRRRYELRLDGSRIGSCAYRDEGARRVLIHTEIEPDYAGQGLATELIVFALEDIRRQGRHAVAQCPMVLHYLEKHHDFDDIIDHPGDAQD